MAILRKYSLQILIGLALFIVIGIYKDNESLKVEKTNLSNDLKQAQDDLDKAKKRNQVVDTSNLNWVEQIDFISKRTPQVLREVIEIEKVAPFNIDDTVPDDVFIPLCVHVFKTDKPEFYCDKATKCLDKRPWSDPLAWCQGEKRPSWSGLLQWNVELISRVARERADKAAIRNFANSFEE